MILLGCHLLANVELVACVVLSTVPQQVTMYLTNGLVVLEDLMLGDVWMLLEVLNFW